MGTSALSKQNVYARLSLSQSISGYYRPAPPKVLVVTEYGLYFTASAIWAVVIYLLRHFIADEFWGGERQI